MSKIELKPNSPGRTNSKFNNTFTNPFLDSISNSENSIDNNNYEFGADYALMLLDKFQNMNEFEDWENKVDEDCIKLWIATKGSFMNEFLPFIHTEMVFGTKYPIELIIDCVNNPAHRNVWDEGIKSCELITELEFGEEVFHTIYNDVNFAAASRDFVEK